MTASSKARSYRVLDVLGRGGFGTVYRAELLGTGGFSKLVALKVLRDEVQADTGALARLRDEARLLGRLHHRAIVAVDSLARLDGRWAVVMEYVEGVTGKEALEGRGPLPVSVALHVVAEVASALHVAYDLARQDHTPLRLLHRDVKPSNVQITPTGGVKLLDFGVARGDLADREAETRSVVYGSVPYLAPERLELQDTHQGDVFALGATLLELLGSRLPGPPTAHPGRHSDRVANAIRGLSEEASAVPGLVELIGRTLTYEPTERPDARTLERACRELLRTTTGPDLGDWAAEVVPALLDTREVSTGDLSGQTLSEEGRSSELGSLTDLQGMANTWDETESMGLPMHGPVSETDDTVRPARTPPARLGPEDEGEPSALPPVPPPALGASSVTPMQPRPPGSRPQHTRRPDPLPQESSGSIGELRAAPPAPPAHPPPVHPPSRRSGLGGIVAVFVGLLGSSALLSVVLVVGVVLVVVMIALSVPMWAFVSAGACEQTFTDMRVQLARDVAGSPGRDEVERLLTQGRRACQSRTIGVVAATTFETEFQGYVADGRITTAEARLLDETLTDLLRR